MADQELPFMCDAVITRIAEHLLCLERQWAFTSMACAGVSRLWRQTVSKVPENQTLILDDLQKAQPLSSRAAAFRKAGRDDQRLFLLSAASLLHGYGSLTASSSLITDRMLMKAAKRSGYSWRSLRIERAPEVTDRALLVAAAMAPQLERLELVGLPAISVLGLSAFAGAAGLEALELADLTAFDGVELGTSTAPAAAIDRQQMSVPNVLRVARLFQALPQLKELKLAVPAAVVFAAIRFCPQLEKLTFLADSPAALHAVVTALPALPKLTALSLTARTFAIPPETARLIGRLPLTSLRLDSAVYENQSSAHRVALSHIDNDAVKALVDGVCSRWHQFAEPGMAGRSELREFKLSLRGATGLAHDAVSTLLRLPVLTELDVSGCSRISAMDKMRLVAKVKAGCEILLKQARRSGCRITKPCGDVATPADHSAFFRGERQSFGAASSQDPSGSAGGSAPCCA